MKSYLVQSVTQLSEEGQTLFTVTLAVPGLTKEEYKAVIDCVGDLGEVTINVESLQAVRLRS